MSPTTRAQSTIHACVVLWGFTAILGKAISLPALPLVWWRMTLVAGLPGADPARMARRASDAAAPDRGLRRDWRRGRRPLAHLLMPRSRRRTPRSAPPAWRWRRCSWRRSSRLLAGGPSSRASLCSAWRSAPGVALVVGGVTAEYRLGIVFGAISAALAALFGALNKRLATHGDPLAITWLQLGAGALLVTALAPLLAGDAPAFVAPGARDLLMLLALAIGCTIIPFSLSLIALRHLSAFATTLAINL